MMNFNVDYVFFRVENSGMVVHTYKTCTEETEDNINPQVHNKPALHSEFPTSQR